MLEKITHDTTIKTLRTLRSVCDSLASGCVKYREDIRKLQRLVDANRAVIDALENKVEAVTLDNDAYIASNKALKTHVNILDVKLRDTKKVIEQQNVEIANQNDFISRMAEDFKNGKN